MELRRFRKEDLRSLGPLMKLAFGKSTPDADWYFNEQRNPRVELDQVHVVEEDGEVRAAATVMPLEMSVDGRAVPAGGISAVATHPAYRRRGHAGGLMRAVLEDMRERGIHLSLLDPFNHAFYRTHGWELAMEHIEYTVSPSELRTSSEQRRVRAYREGDLSRMTALLEAEVAHHPCCLYRREDRWRQLLDGREGVDSGSGGLHAAVYEGDEGVGGYVLYKQSGREGRTPPRRLTISEFVAETPEAWAGLLSFAAAHDPTEFEVRYQTPAGKPLHPYLESSYVKARIEPDMMLRLVDVEGALGLLRREAGEPLVLEVTDETVPENTGSYTLGNGAGRRGARARERVALDVRQLAQLYAGYLPARQLAWRGLIEPGSERALELLEAFFPVGDPWVFPLDRF
ncbi:MAG: enhanced intracellular survival protein Eis [Rubrobacteraceae bacterium]